MQPRNESYSFSKRVVDKRTTSLRVQFSWDAADGTLCVRKHDISSVYGTAGHTFAYRSSTGTWAFSRTDLLYQLANITFASILFFGAQLQSDFELGESDLPFCFTANINKPK